MVRENDGCDLMLNSSLSISSLLNTLKYNRQLYYAAKLFIIVPGIAGEYAVSVEFRTS